MHLNTDPVAPPRKPCIRDLANLTSTLLPPAVVQLMPLKQLKRRVQEINVTHPHFQEETPLVLKYETNRRARLSGKLHLAGRYLTHAGNSQRQQPASRA